MTNLLAIDIGNTSITFGYFQGSVLKKIYRQPTKNHRFETLKKIFPIHRMDAVVIASVVPKATGVLQKEFLKKFKLKTQVVGRNLPVPIVNRYKNPKQVGVDRLLTAVAGFHRYQRELIIIDFGTAITFDVVSKKGDYLGGAIAPGIEISLEALYQKTALLPKIRLAHPRHILGQDTIESIRVGCSYGIAGLCERVIEEIQSACRFRPTIIATGGYARFISRYLKRIDRIEPALILEGIQLTFENSLKKMA